MELKQFENTPREELSMIEVAKAILMERDVEDVIELNELLNEIQSYLGRSDSEMREALPQFYTDLNIDGSFISLGDNRWGLRSWYPIDSIDEEVSHNDEDDEPRRVKKASKVNAFMDNDEDAIDYSNDDPEDNDLTSDSLYDEDEDDENAEIAEYRHDLSSMNSNDEEDIPEGADEDLTIIDHNEEEEEY